MKIGILGPIGGLIIAALILGLFIHLTPADSNWRVLGFVLALGAFGGGIAVANKGEKSGR